MPEELKPDHIGDANGIFLKSCPWCGKRNSKAFSVSDDPGYRRQRVCMSCGAAGPYTDRKEIGNEELVDYAWNRRTPEPGTSVIRWTRYDGTPETLPEERKRVIFYTIAMPDDLRISRGVVVHWQKGDVWAYCPIKPPEGME